MKLKDPNLAPVGGWKFQYIVEKCPRFPDGIFNYVNNTASGAGNFTRLVASAMQSNGVAIPENLRDLIEDYICTYQPDSRCNYTRKLGDQASRVIHKAAGVVDAVFKTQLKKKAKGCSSCGRKRNKLNQL